MIDYAFIRLEQNIYKADNIGNPLVSEIVYNDQIHLKPNEVYNQITNTDFGITLAGDYQVFIADKCGNEIEEITNQIDFRGVVDIRGLNQVSFEFFLLKDYFEEIRLKIKTVTSDEIYWSNLFVCTNFGIEETSYFVYRDYGYFKGISYDRLELYQSIRIKTYFDNPINDTQSDEYYQVTKGNTISSNALYKQLEGFKAEYLNKFVFERANIMLIQEVVYINGVRITNKPQYNSDERLGGTNVFVATLEAYLDYNDTFEYKKQILEDFEIIELYPIGKFLNNNKPIEFIITLNKNVTDFSEVIVRLYDSNDTLIKEYLSSDLDVENNEIKGILEDIVDNTSYYFMTNDKIIHINENIEAIESKTEWTFRTSVGDYSSLDYNNVDYTISN